MGFLKKEGMSRTHMKGRKEGEIVGVLGSSSLRRSCHLTDFLSMVGVGFGHRAFGPIKFHFNWVVITYYIRSPVG